MCVIFQESLPPSPRKHVSPFFTKSMLNKYVQNNSLKGCQNCSMPRGAYVCWSGLGIKCAFSLDALHFTVPWCSFLLQSEGLLTILLT